VAQGNPNDGRTGPGYLRGRARLRTPMTFLRQF
jgi:hypothetical protein